MPPSTNHANLRKEYFETKLAEFTSGCESGSPAACFSLGEWYQLIAKDFSHAAHIYADNCIDRGDANSCYNLASLLLSQQINPDQIPKLKKENKNVDAHVRSLCDRACEINSHGLACTTSAHFALSGRGGSMDTARGLGLLERLCASPINDARACVRLGSAFLKPSYGLQRDPTRAFTIMRRACDDLGHPNACQVLAVMYGKGDGVEIDKDKSEDYKIKTRQLFEATGEQLGHDIVVPPPPPPPSSNN